MKNFHAVFRLIVNCGGSIDLLDIQPFVELLVSGNYSEKANLNSDGIVSLDDPFIDALSAN